MATFDSIMNCSIGGTAFQLLSYTKSRRRTYTDALLAQEEIQFQLTGEVQAANVGALATALAALEESCEDGTDLTITGLNNVNLDGLAASTVTFGPRYDISYGADQSATHQQVTITATGVIDMATEAGGGELGEGVLSVTQTITTSKNAEDLPTITTKGTVTTEAGTSAVTEAVTLIPAGIEGPYVRTQYQYEQENAADTKASYTVSYQQLVAAYPTYSGQSVVEGEATISTSTDAHNRLIVTYTYQYVGTYAEAYINDRLATLRATGNLVRANIESTVHKSRSVRATFEVLGCRDSGTADLLELTETIRNQRSGPLLDQRIYSGTNPLIFKLPQAGILYVQSGRAIGLKKYPKPPDKKFSAAYLVDESINFNRLNDQEFETTWEFPFLFASEQSVVLPSDRSDNNGFYS